MKHYIYFILHVITILCVGGLVICVAGAFVEYEVNLGANYITGLLFFGVVSLLVITFVIMWLLTCWCHLQRAINRSK